MKTSSGGLQDELIIFFLAGVVKGSGGEEERNRMFSGAREREEYAKIFNRQGSRRTRVLSAKSNLAYLACHIAVQIEVSQKINRIKVME